MKRILAIILVISVLSSLCVFAEDSETNIYEKIHLNSLCVSDYATIDSAEELEVAVELMKKTDSVFSFTVHFISFVYDPGSYPRLFKNLPYTEIKNNDYAPEVYIKVKAENITASALEGLAKNDMIAWITSDSRIIPDFVPSNGNVSFTDVKKSAWYYDHVKNAYSMGLMEGTTATTFAPNATLTRAMLVTMIGRFEERLYGELTVSTEGVFSDVKAGKWYSDYVAWAAEKGVIEGYPDGTFRPNAPFTREEAVTILGRYHNKNAPGMLMSDAMLRPYYPHTDTAEISDWAEKWVHLGMSMRAVHFVMRDSFGKPETAPEYYFRPGDTITRAEAAKVAYIFLSSLEESIERGYVKYQYDGLTAIK